MLIQRTIAGATLALLLAGAARAKVLRQEPAVGDRKGPVRQGGELFVGEVQLRHNWTPIGRAVARRAGKRISKC